MADVEKVVLRIRNMLCVDLQILMQILTCAYLVTRQLFFMLDDECVVEIMVGP